ncbi:MAG: biotin transporter BioY [Clostridiaceae bacterium]|jgi:biotin transport system substrate-specific component|nr:biotin transporter BioY [Clostridiaceae bacterium]
MRKTEIRNIVLIALFAALMIVGAYLKIPNPFFPVYFTFQTIFSILAGLLIGSRKGAMSMTLYMAMGLAGLPVFSTPAGIHYILNPTFGYILGFIAAAWAVGKISELFPDYTIGAAFLASSAGILSIYFSGTLYMYLLNIFYTGTPIGYFGILSGMALYFIKDLILIIPAAFLSVQIRKRTAFVYGS